MKHARLPRYKKDTNYYDFECLHCGEVFMLGEEEDMAEHEAMHKKAIKQALPMQVTPTTDFWRRRKNETPPS